MKNIAPPILLALFCGLAVTEVRALEPDVLRSATARGLAEVPLYFEANQGQADGAARFIARGTDSTILISPVEASLQVEQAGQMRTVRLTLSGASPAAEMSGVNELPGRASYFIGDSSAQWRVGVPLFSRVRVAQVYPGIDVVYYADHSARLEYDFLLQAGADPGQISLHITGADKVRLDAGGNLVVKIGGQEIRQHQPVIYQTVNGVRREIQGGYRLTGKTTAGFRLGAYDRSLPLVIDPVFSTYLGGKYGDSGWDITTDASGNVYVCGDTFSPDLRMNAPAGAYRTNYAGTQGTKQYGDAFVAKYYPTNGVLALSYLTYLGGKGQESARGIAADADGNAYVTGFTDSPNFPITHNAAFSRISGRNNTVNSIYRVDAFVTKLGKEGTNLLYSTFLGGGERDAGYAIAVNAGYAFVTGFTESTNFPVRTNLLATRVVQNKYGGVRDAFVTKVGLTGTNLEYSTYLGGRNQDCAYGIAVDAAGCAYLTGYTLSTNFPTFPLHSFWLNGQTNRTFAFDAFFTKIAADGSSNVFSTFLGGENTEVGLRLALDYAKTGDSAYVTGYTFSTNFPVTTAITNTRTWTNPNTNGFADIFVTKFSLISSNGTYATSSPGYSVVFGGRTTDEATGIAVDSAGNAILTGYTSSTNLFNVVVVTNLTVSKTNRSGSITPITYTNVYYDMGTNLLDSSSSTAKKYQRNTNNVFVAVLNPNATAFTYAALFGGSGNDIAHGIALDLSRTNIYLVGSTTSSNFPAMSALQTRPGGKQNNNDVFILAVNFTSSTAIKSPAPANSDGPTLFITQSNGTVTLTWTQTALNMVLESSPGLAPADWQPVGVTPSLAGGWLSVTVSATDQSGYFRLREH